MKLKKNGMLLIQAETELEAYAIEKWSEDNTELPAGMIISWGIQKEANNTN